MSGKLHKRILFFVLVSLIFQPGVLIGQGRKQAVTSDRPKLILQIKIDQLRGDLPSLASEDPGVILCSVSCK